MKIISKFHDYYDTAMSMGIDIDCIYDRKREEMKLKSEIQLISSKKISKGKRDYIIYPMLIGFAGNIYPLVKVETTFMVGLEIKNYEDFFYSFDEWKAFLETSDLKQNDSRWIWNKSVLSIKEAGTFFDPTTWKKQTLLFRKHYTPVFIITPDVGYRVIPDLIINPTLLFYRFGKIKDAYTAFQDIYMYLSGVLGSKENEMIKISDKDKLWKKGFDNFSFKKRKK